MMMCSTPFLCRTTGCAFPGEQIARSTDMSQVEQTGRGSWLLHPFLAIYLFVDWKGRDGEWGGAGMNEAFKQRQTFLLPIVSSPPAVRGTPRSRQLAQAGRILPTVWLRGCRLGAPPSLPLRAPCLAVPAGGAGAGRQVPGGRRRAAGGGQRGPAPLGGTAGSRTAPPYLRRGPARPGPARHSPPTPSDWAGQREPPAPPASLCC